MQSAKVNLFICAVSRHIRTYTSGPDRPVGRVVPVFSVEGSATGPVLAGQGHFGVRNW